MRLNIDAFAMALETAIKMPARMPVLIFLMSYSPAAIHAATIDRELCFFEYRFELSSEQDFEKFIDSKFALEDRFIKSIVPIRPLTENSIIYFGDDCSKRAYYARDSNEAALFDSTFEKYLQILEIERSETK